jgi:hypothetical protein
MSRARVVSYGVAAWVGVLVATAATQALAADPPPSAADKAAAQALFDEGRLLLAKKEYREACSKFADSQRLDPKGGTLLNLAACNEALGKIATAWTQFNEALSIAIRDGRADRVTVAKNHIAAIEPKLARLTLRVLDPSIDGLTIVLDGEPLARAAWGTAAPIDPGDHTIDAKAPRRLPFHGAVRIESKDAEIEVPKLSEDPSAPPPEAPPASTSHPAPVPEPAAPLPPPPDNAARHIGGGVVLGAGIVAIGIGSYFGLRAFSKWHDAQNECPRSACSALGESLISDSKSAARIADVAIGVGVVAAGFGAYFLFTSPHHGAAPTTALRVGAVGTGTGVALDGAW